MKQLPLVFLFVLLLLASCKKDQQSSSVNFHADYFPLEEGRFVIYQVREVVIDDDLAQNDTADYYIKAIIGPQFIDDEGRLAHRYERYRRANLADPWVIKDIWTTIVEKGRAELVEENQRVIKLVFAPTLDKQWNANAYNPLPELNCYYRDIHVPQTVSGFAFDSTLVVEQDQYLTFIDYRRKFETYAKGVGMIYKHFKDFRILSQDTLNVTRGYEMTMRLIDFGVE